MSQQHLPQTVLLVENDDNWAGLERKVLENLDVIVERAVDSEHAIRYMSSDELPDLIVCDLHMPGSNGDVLLRYLVENNVEVPFVIASGTLCNEGKMALVEAIPGLVLFSKEDFLDTNIIRAKLPDVMQNPVHQRPSAYYLSVLEKVKADFSSVPDALIEASRIKGRVMQFIDYFGKGNWRREGLGQDYDLLKEFQYHGKDEADTISRLHDLKNILSAKAHSEYDADFDIQTEMLRIADDIVQILNTPRSKTIFLDELVERVAGNLLKIYSTVDFFNKVPGNIKINEAGAYSRIVYSLIENAFSIAKYEPPKVVSIEYDNATGSLVIINNGQFPREYLHENGMPNMEKIVSQKDFGTGFGIRDCVQGLEKVGAKLRYKQDNNKVKAYVDLSIAEIVENNSAKKTQKPKVLFLDYTDGERFSGIGRTMRKLSRDFEYVWDSELNNSHQKVLELPFEEYFLIIAHPYVLSSKKAGVCTIWDSEAVVKNPHIRYAIVNGHPEGMQDMIDTHTRHLEDKDVIKPLKDYVDFLGTYFPSANDLDSLIQQSYEKYQADVGKTQTHEKVM